MADLKKLGENLRDRCQAQLASLGSVKNGQQEPAGPGKRKARITFMLGGVTVNAKTLSQCENEMAPLDEMLPSDTDEKLRWQLDFRYVNTIIKLRVPFFLDYHYRRATTFSI